MSHAHPRPKRSGPPCPPEVADAVFRSCLSPYAKLACLFLAGRARTPAGEVRCSLPELARACDLPEVLARLALEELRAEGWLERRGEEAWFLRVPPAVNTAPRQAREKPPEGCTIVPNSVFLRSDVSAGAKAVYVLLLMFASRGEPAPEQRLLAEVLGCSERTLRSYLNELREAGLVAWRRRGLTQANVYYL